MISGGTGPLTVTTRITCVQSGSAQAGIGAPQASGLSIEQVAKIKEAIQGQQKFLGELVEHGNRWELDGPELRIYFSPDKRPFAEMLEAARRSRRSVSLRARS